MHKIITTLILLIASSFLLSAQDDTITYNIQDQEIGIDFQNIFKASGVLGSNLIYKKRLRLKDSTSFSRAKVFRLRIGGFASADINSKESLETNLENITEGNGIIEAENNLKPENFFSANILAGIEWQMQKKRIQYFSGFEVGYGLQTSSEINDLNYSGNELQRINSQKDRTHSFKLNGIGGCKFFLSPNFSIALETSIEGSFNIVRETNTLDDRVIESTRITTVKNNEFLMSMDYLNALYFSYYF